MDVKVLNFLQSLKLCEIRDDNISARLIATETLCLLDACSSYNYDQQLN